MPNISRVHREYLPVGLRERSATEHLYLLRHALAVTMQRMHRAAPDARAVVLSAAAPWMRVELQHAHIDNTEDLTAHPDLITQILERARYENTDAALLPVRTSAGHMARHDDSVKSAPAALHVACVHECMHATLADTLQRLHAHTHIYTRAHVLTNALAELYPHARDMQIIDIADEATEITSLKDGALQSWHMVPYGTTTFLRSVAGASGTIPEEIRLYLRRHFGRTSIPEHIRDALECALCEYRATFDRTIAQMPRTVPHLCIVHDSPYAEPLMDTIQALDAYADSAEISPEYGYDLATCTDDISPPDFRLAALASFAHTQRSLRKQGIQQPEVLY